MGEYRFIDHDGTRIGALCGVMPGEQPQVALLHPRPVDLRGQGRPPKTKGGTIHMGPHQVPTGDCIVIGTDPQGAEFALVGGAVRRENIMATTR